MTTSPTLTVSIDVVYAAGTLNMRYPAAKGYRPRSSIGRVSK